MTPDDDLTALAEGLTEAMRNALTRGTDIGTVCNRVVTARGLVARGLATHTYPDRSRMLDWKPLGLRLRAHFAKEVRDGRA